MDSLTFKADIELQAADENKPVRVSILAYSGGLMKVGNFGTVLLDLKGLDVSGKIPILVDHENTLGAIAGTGTARIEGGKVYVDGTLLRSSDVAQKIIDLHREGLSFEASVGVAPSETKYIRPGESVFVNGQTFAPREAFTHVLAGKLREVSIVAIGADASTAVTIAAKGNENMSETTNPETIRAAEAERLRGITQACGDRLEIAARAAEEGWTVEAAQIATLEAKNKDLELEMIRASRKTGPAIHDGGRLPDDKPALLQAALMLHTGQRAVAEHYYNDEILSAAASLKIRHAMDWRDKACGLLGIPAKGVEAAGFSTVSLSGVLGDSATKSMEVAYKTAGSAARIVARKLSAKNFLSHTGYRMTGDFVLKEVGAAGELKHATIDEQSYSYSVDTYGRTFGITRQNWINDDLGAFAEIPKMIGRGAALALEQAFFTLVLANTSDFFGTGNSNQITTGLGSAGLRNAVAKLRDQTDADGNPIGVTPKYLMVPTGLEETADELFVSTNIVLDGSSSQTKQPDGNVYKGKYVPVVSPYLNNSSYTGYSTTAWYLLGDPADVAAFGVAYLNGNESPVIEAVDVSNDTLGTAWRGYLDFGVCQIDHRGGVKSTGAG